MTADQTARRRELAAGLAAVHDRIRSACASAQRPEDDVALIVVTKTWPAEDVRLLAGLGVTDVGENRHPEAGEKHAASRDLGLTWHFVGALQTNKAAAVARYADVVHSVDRPKLVRALSRGAEAAGRHLDCLLQVSLDPPDDRRGRSGAAPEDIPRLAGVVAGLPHLRVAGVMGIPPLGGDPVAAFARLAESSQRLRTEHPDAGWISAGMSADLEPAIAAGATHVRVGSAIMGRRDDAPVVSSAANTASGGQ